MNKNETNETIVFLHWKDLEPHPKNPRRDFPAEQVEEMARSIAAQGVLQPLVCVPLGDGRARIVMGHVRWSGAKMLGEEAPLLPCRLVEWDENRQMLAMITENMARYDLDPVAEAEYLGMLKEELGMSPAEISETTGLGQSLIRDRLKLLHLPEPVQDFIGRGDLPPTMGRYFQQLKDDQAVELAHKCVEERVPVTRMKSILDALPEEVFKHSSRKKRGQRREKHARARRPRIVTTTEILEEYEGMLALAEIGECVRVVCRKCREDGEVCQQCPLTELVRVLICQPGVLPAGAEPVTDTLELMGLTGSEMRTVPGHAPGWREIV